MHLPELLRDARRRRGLSVRRAAERCDVPRTTWASWESGRAAPPADRLEEVLRSLRLDLLLVDRVPEPAGELRVVAHLRRSLTERAAAALGDQLDRVVAATAQGWDLDPDLRRLTGPAAAGIWVPHVVARGPLPLPAADPADPGVVPVHLLGTDGVTRGLVLAPTPAALIADGRAETWPQLRTSARLLADGPRDAAGRRLPPHRDPDETRERRDLMLTLEWGGRGKDLVSPTSSRGWRLDAPASLDEALRWQGLRPRNASRRGRGDRGPDGGDQDEDHDPDQDDDPDQEHAP